MSSTPRQPALTLARYLRRERPVPVPGHVDPDRTDIGQHRLVPHTIAGVPAVLTRRVALVIAQVIGDLTFQGRPQDPLRELLQQTTIPGQLQTRRTGLPHQLSDQLRVDTVRRLPRPVLRHRGSIHGGHRSIGHQVLLLDQELHPFVLQSPPSPIPSRHVWRRERYVSKSAVTFPMTVRSLRRSLGVPVSTRDSFGLREALRQQGARDLPWRPQARWRRRSPASMTAWTETIGPNPKRPRQS
jgi:hypothetical protein